MVIKREFVTVHCKTNQDFGFRSSLVVFAFATALRLNKARGAFAAQLDLILLA